MKWEIANKRVAGLQSPEEAELRAKIAMHMAFDGWEPFAVDDGVMYFKRQVTE